ncbi:MAG: hypothetical protein JXB36_16565 [Gammaproteobacteria bacterium]|nr:hypothetical protein [Gammaproteobacteria bacterium]
MHRYLTAVSTRVVIASAMSLGMIPITTAQEEDWRTWGEMREQVVGAEELLEGDVSNGLNPVASVSNLLLSEDGSRIEYVMMEVPFPYTVYGGMDGFVAFDRVDVQGEAGLETDLVIDRDEPISPPEELRLSATEANNRLVSRLIDQRMHFPGQGTRQITDMLIDRKTGVITHWVVEMAEDALFSTERRAIPASEISIDEGVPTAQIEVATLDELQQFESQFL